MLSRKAVRSKKRKKVGNCLPLRILHFYELQIYMILVADPYMLKKESPFLSAYTVTIVLRKKASQTMWLL